MKAIVVIICLLAGCSGSSEGPPSRSSDAPSSAAVAPESAASRAAVAEEQRLRDEAKAGQERALAERDALAKEKEVLQADLAAAKRDAVDKELKAELASAQAEEDAAAAELKSEPVGGLSIREEMALQARLDAARERRQGVLARMIEHRCTNSDHADCRALKKEYQRLRTRLADDDPRYCRWDDGQGGSVGIRCKSATGPVSPTGKWCCNGWVDSGNENKIEQKCHEEGPFSCQKIVE